MTSDAEIVIGIRGDLSGGKQVQRTLDDIEKSGERAKRGAKNFQDEMKRTDATARLLSNTLKTLGISFGLRELQQAADAYTNIQNRLKLVTDGTANLAAVTKELFAISNDTRMSFEATAELYARVALATKDLGLSQRDTLNFSKSLNQAVILSGASAAEASAGLIQLSQGLASGTLRGDELRSVLEQLPAVADVIAKGLGVTRGELRKMGEDGLITADIIIDAFKKAETQLDTDFAKTVTTIGQAFTLLRNKVIESIGDLDAATGSSQKLAFVIGKLGDVISLTFNSLAALAQALQGVFTDVVGSILSITTAMVNGIEKVMNVGVSAVNVFRDNKISKIDLNGGLTSENIVAAQTEMSGANYSDALKSVSKADQSAASFFGFGTAAANGNGDISTTRGPNRTPPRVNEDAIKAQKQIDKVTESLKFNLEQLKRNDLEQEIYNNLRSAGVTIDSAAGREIANLTTLYNENSKVLETQKRVIDGVAQATEGFFEEWFTGADGFKGAIKGMIGQLADLAFQMSVIEPIKNNLFGSAGAGGGIFGSLLGGLFGGSKVTSGSFAVKQVANIGSGLYGPGFASGGSMILGGNSGIDQNQLSLNGAPIARVGRGEVLNVSPSQSGGGAGIVINQTFQISTGVAQTVAAEFAAFLPKIQSATQAAINEANARGIQS